MHRIFIGIITIVLGSCAMGRPPGFSKGSTWTIPLMGVLEDGLPVTPVRINGKGPYLFFVHPDASTTIDPRLASELDLWTDTTRRVKLVNSEDDISHEQLTFITVPRLSVGDLTVSNQQFVAMKTDAFYRGQPVRGMIGKDIVGRSSLIWSLDRDRQILHLATQGHFTPPENAQPVTTTTRHGRSFVKARINERIAGEFRVVFYGTSAIWPALARQAQLDVMAEGAWLARTVQIGQVAAGKQIFVPFQDARVAETDHDGEIGRGVWSNFNIAMNPHRNTMWLQPRARDQGKLASALIKDRLQRWSGQWDGCGAPACVTLAVEDAAPDAQGEGSEGAPVAPVPAARDLVITRETSHQDASYDVLVEALDQSGASMRLPYIIIALPPGFTTRRIPFSSMEGAYASAASFRVIDATPFPAPCSSSEGCFWLAQ